MGDKTTTDRCRSWCSAQSSPLNSAPLNIEIIHPLEEEVVEDIETVDLQERIILKMNLA